MFKCQICGENSEPCEQPVKAVLQFREKEYRERLDKYDNVIDQGGFGHETVKEVTAHKACAGNIEPQCVYRVPLAFNDEWSDAV